MRRLGKRNNKRKLASFIIFFLVLDIILFTVFSVRLKPMIETLAVQNTKIAATRAINDAVGNAIKKSGLDYDKLMIVETNSAGTVTAIKSNTIAIDLLKHEITNEVINSIDSINKSSLSIPVGTLLGSQLFNNYGPRLSVRIEPVGSVNTKITNSFTSTGINQTRQQINLEVKVNLTVLVANYSVNTDVSTTDLIADTVIVGDVPDSYTVIGDSSALDSTDKKIYAYGNKQ